MKESDAKGYKVILCIAVIMTVVVLFFLSLRPVMITIVKANGATIANLTSNVNNNKVKQYCDGYCLYNTNSATDTEHIFSQDWANQIGKKEICNDYHNLRVCDKITNNEYHGNKKYGEVEHNLSTERRVNGVITCYVDKENKVFEPIDEYKGDIARVLLYMYYNYGLNQSQIVNFFDLRLMKEWSKLDKVDESEKAVCENVNKNEGYDNVFVSNPFFQSLFLI